MRRIPVLVAATLIALLMAASSVAQPLFTTVHDWTLETPIGQFGYQQIRQDPGGIHVHYLVASDARYAVDVATLVLLGIAALLFSALLILRRVLRRRGA
jgi:hypothetical protein